MNEETATLAPRGQRAVAESVALADLALREIRTASYLLHPPELAWQLTLGILDAGTGMRGTIAPGVGIASMRHRVQQLRGSLDIVSSGAGTALTVTIPLSGDA